MDNGKIIFNCSNPRCFYGNSKKHGGKFLLRFCNNVECSDYNKGTFVERRFAGKPKTYLCYCCTSGRNNMSRWCYENLLNDTSRAYYDKWSRLSNKSVVDSVRPLDDDHDRVHPVCKSCCQGKNDMAWITFLEDLNPVEKLIYIEESCKETTTYPGDTADFHYIVDTLNQFRSVDERYDAITQQYFRAKVKCYQWDREYKAYEEGHGSYVDYNGEEIQQITDDDNLALNNSDDLGMMDWGDCERGVRRWNDMFEWVGRPTTNHVIDFVLTMRQQVKHVEVKPVEQPVEQPAKHAAVQQKTQGCSVIPKQSEQIPAPKPQTQSIIKKSQKKETKKPNKYIAPKKTQQYNTPQQPIVIEVPEECLVTPKEPENILDILAAKGATNVADVQPVDPSKNSLTQKVEQVTQIFESLNKEKVDDDSDNPFEEKEKPAARDCTLQQIPVKAIIPKVPVTEAEPWSYEKNFKPDHMGYMFENGTVTLYCRDKEGVHLELFQTFKLFGNRLGINVKCNDQFATVRFGVKNNLFVVEAQIYDDSYKEIQTVFSLNHETQCMTLSLAFDGFELNDVTIFVDENVVYYPGGQILPIKRDDRDQQPMVVENGQRPLELVNQEHDGIQLVQAENGQAPLGVVVQENQGQHPPVQHNNQRLETEYDCYCSCEHACACYRDNDHNGNDSPLEDGQQTEDN